jgi:hypothetical protein
MTWTNPAASGSPGTSRVTSLLSLKFAPPVNSWAVSAHHPVLFGAVAVAPRRVLGLEAGQLDEAAVLGHPGGGAQPADGPGGELLDPPVEGGLELARSATWPLIT